MADDKPSIIVGHDLNETKGPLDKKVYRQILLPNGLRAVLISDVAAMNQIQSEGGLVIDDGDDEGEDEEDEVEAPSKPTRLAKADDESPEDNGGESEGEDDGVEDEDDEEEPSWLRDAAAALTVGVGSFSDPSDCQGLAHFLEHLLFMGSEKYPVENEFDAFMSKHGGAENAFTESETTTYYFSIPQEYLGGALDRLSQFFIAPLLLQSGVERELKAIESEYQLNKQNDHARLQQLWSTTSHNPDHPFSQFQWGNIKSHKEIPEQENVDPMVRLRSFYDKHYYASNMRLAIVGAYSCDDLQEMVVKCLSDVPALPRDGSMNGNAYVASWDSVYASPIAKRGLPFSQDAFKLYRIIPVKDRHNLSISWQLPPQMGRWKTKPCDYIAHLLGHEAQGSLLSALKKKQWATTCVAGAGNDGMENASTHTLFSMTFTLSVEGVDHWHEIIAFLYMYIGMLRHYGTKLPEWIYVELRSMHEFAHRYADEQSPEDLVENIVEDMAPHYNLPPERLLDGSRLLFGHDPKEVLDLLDYFNPNNARIDFMSTTFGRASDFDLAVDSAESQAILQPSVKFDREQAGPPRKEPWFGTYYWVQHLDDEMVQQWSDLAAPQMPKSDSMLSLPPQNPFVPTEFNMKPTPPDDSDHPFLNCSLKLCVEIGKTKQWLPATVTKFNSIKNQVLVSYEDEEEKWHKVDHDPKDLSRNVDAEGTFDGKKIKFRVVAVPKDGEGPIRKFGDDSDFDVLDGTQFPAIPPAKSASRLPQLIRSTQLLKFWHMQDRTFLRPIAELRVAVFSNKANESALHKACTELIVQLCHDVLTETVYMASLCELGSTIESSEVGFGFRINGFDDKLLQLFEVVFGRLLSFRGRTPQQGLPDGIEDSRFNVCIEMLQRKYQNTGMGASPLASGIRVRCICPDTWSASQKAEAIKDLELPKFVEVASTVLQDLSVQAFFHGNVDEKDAKCAADMIESMIKATPGGVLPKKKYYYQYVTKIPESSTPQIITAPSKDEENGNTAVEIYFQVGKDNIKERVLIDMLIHLMAEPLYNQLRTKEQFGYRVSCDSRWTVGVMGMKFVVVTATKSAAATTKRIDEFLNEFRKTLVEMTPQDFFENLVALAKEKLDMFNSLAEETSAFWAEIRDGRFDWEVNRNEALALRSVTKEMVIEAFDSWLNPNHKRRSVVVQVIAKEQKDSDGDAAAGRPEVSAEDVTVYIDNLVKDFHQLCKNQTWGKIFA